MIKLPKDYSEFIELLNEHKVKYLVVGGYAVAVHGYPRFTGDIDFWIKPEEKNAHLVLKVLNKFGIPVSNISSEDLTQPNNIIQLGYQPVRIELLTKDS